MNENISVEKLADVLNVEDPTKEAVLEEIDGLLTVEEENRQIIREQKMNDEEKTRKLSTLARKVKNISNNLNSVIEELLKFSKG